MKKLITRRKLLRVAAIATPALILPSRRLLARPMHGAGGGGGGDWILANGVWDDAGVWDDTAVWKDVA